MSEWKEHSIGDVAEVIGGGTPKTKIPEYWEGEISWLTPRDLSNHQSRFITTGERNISALGLSNSSAKLLPPGTVLLSSRAPVGYLAIATNEIATNQGFRSLIPNEYTNNEFLYYLLLNNVEYLKSQSTGTTFGELSGSTLKSLIFIFPPLPEQKAIAAVLSSLDDKIDLLRRQNATLEAMAQTLFRQWFIEEAGEGWKEIKLGNYVNCTTGYSYRSKYLNPSHNALITLKNFARDGSFRMDGFKEYTGSDHKDEQVVVSGDLVVAHTDITQNADIVGNPALVVDTGKYEKLIITMDLMKVESTVDWLSKEFLYFLFKSREFKHYCLGRANGTTVLHLSRKAIPEFEFKVSSKKRIHNFTETASPMIRKQHENIYQIQTLEKLRDTLLPKLMSGEVRVKH